MPPTPPTPPFRTHAVVYDLLLKVAAETLITIAADPKHLGAHIGCKRRSKNPSLKRPVGPVAPE